MPVVSFRDPIESRSSSLQTSQLFQAHWDSSFGRLKQTTWKKVCRVAWDIFSILVFPIGLIRLAAHKVNQKIHPLVLTILLPATLKSPEDINNEKHLFFNDFLKDPKLPLPFTVETHTIVTPDKAELAVQFFRHSNAGPDTPTIVYFNPNGCISYERPFETLLQELKNHNTPFNFVAFDYRGTGESKGEPDRFDDLVTDGISVVQWVKEKIGAPKNQIHFYGWSLGGAVAADVMAQDTGLTGRFCSERSLASTDDMIDYISPKAPIQGKTLKIISRWLGQSFDVVPAFNRLKGRKLVVYHSQDSVLPYAVSLERRVKNIPHQTIQLVSGGAPISNHHCAPLSLYDNALQKIGDFFFTL